MSKETGPQAGMASDEVTQITLRDDSRYAQTMAAWSLRDAYSTVMLKWILWSLVVMAVCCAVFFLGGLWIVPAAVLGVIILVAMFVVQPIQMYVRLKSGLSGVAEGRTGYVAHYRESSFNLLPPFGGSRVISYSSLRKIRRRGQLISFDIAPTGQRLMMPLRVVPTGDVAWLQDRAARQASS